MKIRDLFKKKVNNKTDDRILALEEEVKIMIEKAISEDRFSFFEFTEVHDTLERVANLNDYDRYEFFFNVAKNWDDNFKFSRETGNYINEICKNSEDGVLAVHRSNLGPIEYLNGNPQNDNVNDILTMGLINNGHAMQGAYDEVPSLTLTTTPLDGLTGLINLVASYKNNNAIVILKFPKEYVDEELSFVSEESYKKIYNKDGIISYIDPSYIMGIILKDEDGVFKIHDKDELLKNNHKKM